VLASLPLLAILVLLAFVQLLATPRLPAFLLMLPSITHVVSLFT
jgi:hypothetical protein